MGHQIIIENSTIEDSEITNRVYLSAEDGSIVIRGMKLTKTKLVNDLDIPQFCSVFRINAWMLQKEPAYRAF